MSLQTKICPGCNNSFEGRPNAQSCSVRCRKRIFRAKQALKGEVDKLAQLRAQAEDNLKDSLGLRELAPSVVTETPDNYSPDSVSDESSLNSEDLNWSAASTELNSTMPTAETLETLPPSAAQPITPAEPLKAKPSAQHWQQLQDSWQAAPAATVEELGEAGTLPSENLNTVPESSKSARLFKHRPALIGLSFAGLVMLLLGTLTLTGLFRQNKPSPSDLNSQIGTISNVSSNKASKLTINLDTTIKGKLGIGQEPTSTASLQVAGDIQSSATLLASGGSTSLNNDGLTINKVVVCTVAGCNSNTAGTAVNLQDTTPGTAQTGNVNVSGTITASNFSGNGSNLTTINATTLQGNSSSFFTNATNISSGTIADARLSTNVTLQGNTFNGASQLVQTTAGGILPIISGANLTSLNGSSISSGTVADARLSTNVAFLNGTGPQIFTGNNKFTGTLLAQNSADSTAALSIQNAAGKTVLTTDTSGGIVTLGSSGVSGVTGNLKFNFTAQTGSISLVPLSPASTSYTLNLPAENGTLCSTGSVCTGYQASGNYFLQGGNSFGATAVLGTNDSNSLTFETNNATQATIAVGGATTFQNSADSTTAFQIQNTASANLFQVDSTNSGNITLLGNNSGEVTSWTATSSLPAVRDGFGSVVANGYVYVVGGGDGTALQDDVYYAKLNADGTVGTFNSTTLLPENRGTFPTLTANGYLYMIGGDIAGSEASNIYYAKLSADGTVGSWALNSTSLPLELKDHGGVAYNGYVYIMGGRSGAAGQRHLYYAKLNADGSIGSWTTVTNSLPATRERMGTAVVNGYVYVVGGRIGTTETSTVYYAKLNTDGTVGAFATTTAIPGNNRAGVSAVASNGYLYALGGIDELDVYQNTVYYAALNADGTVGSWSTSANPFTTGKQLMGSAVANGYIYLLGGDQGSTAYTTVQYTSTARIKLGGNLDLVGLSGENLNEGGSGGQLTAGNTKIVGTLDVSDQVNLNGSLYARGNFTNNGYALFQNATNSSTAFQAQTAVGSTVLGLSTITLQNFITNSSFESNTTGWAKLQGAETTFAVAATGTQDGSQSLQVTTDGVTANQGALYTYYFKPNTTYDFSIYASVSTGSIATFDLGTSINGSVTTCLAAQTVTTTVTRYSCSFTTGATTTATDYLFARRTTAAIVTLYFDAAQLEYGSTASLYRQDVTPNLITNPNAETSSNGWAIKDTATSVATSEDFANFGNRSIKVVTSTAANNGASYNYPFTASSRYSLSVWLKRDTSSTATINIGRQDVSGTDVDCLTGQTVTTTWTQYTCTFTTGATITAPSSLYIKQTDTTTDNIYIDGLTLVAAGAAQPYKNDAISLQVDPLYNSIVLNGQNSGELSQWNQNANALPAVRVYSSSVVANGYVYTIGGSADGSNTLSTVYYAKLNVDGSTGAWSTNANALPAVRGQHSSVVANGYVYVIGGFGASAAESTVYYAKLNVDGSTGAWSTNANALPVVLRNHSSVVANGYVYVIGGTTVATVYYAKLNADGSTGAWSTNANALPATRDIHSSVVANGYVYVIGGSTTSTVYYAKLNADGSTGAWSTNTANPLPVVLDSHSSVVANGYVYVIGGTTGTIQSTIYYAKLNADGSTGAWSVNTNTLPGIRKNHSSVVANGYVYVIGGTTGTVQSTVFYASTSRVLVGGNLDLVVLGGQNLAEGGDFSQGSTGGSLTAGNTKIVGSLEVQGQSNFAQSIAVNGNGSFFGDISIGAQTNNTPHTFTSTCGCMVNATAGTFGADTGRDAVLSSAVYNGKLYVSTAETDLSGIYRYDGGNTWTLVTNAVGKIVAGDTANIDTSVLAVYNGKLYVGTQTGVASGTGAIYSYDGTTWTLAQTTRGTFGAQTAVDGVSSLAVSNGRIYAFSQETNLASVYRFDGNNATWTLIGSASGKLAAGDTIDIDAGVLINYGGNLWAGAATGSSTARVEKYDGNVWTLMNTTTGTFAAGTTSVNDVTSMAVYNDQLFIGTSKNDLADIYVFKGGYDGGAGADVFYKTTATSGRIDATADATDVDGVYAMTVYNGRLYAGSSNTVTTSGTGALYEYTGISTTSVNGWTMVNGTRGTFGAQTGLESVGTLIQYNGSLYVGTEDTASNNGAVYSYTKISNTSYSLQFSSATTAANSQLNTGGISFIGDQQTTGNAANTGSFVFTHGIMSTAGAYDIAEDYPTRDQSLKPGDLVSIDLNEVGFVRRTSLTGDSTILGIYSQKPGLRLSQADSNIDGAKAVPIALAGRVPVNVVDENGPIMPGDYLTSSSTPGYAMKATQAGPTIGKALEGYGGPGTGKIQVFVNISYFVPAISNILQGGSNSIASLMVSGELTALTLTINGDAQFKGNVTLAGHIITAGAVPTVQVLTASAEAPVITVDGNDVSGTISISTATATQPLQPGNLLKLIFKQPYDKKPRVFLDPANLDAVSVQIYKDITPGYFIIKLIGLMDSGKTYDFDYFIVQ